MNEVLQTNIRLEDVFHMTNCRNMGVAFHHSGHILHGKLNYILTYDTNLIKDQRHALMVRDKMDYDISTPHGFLAFMNKKFNRSTNVDRNLVFPANRG